MIYLVIYLQIIIYNLFSSNNNINNNNNNNNNKILNIINKFQILNKKNIILKIYRIWNKNLIAKINQNNIFFKRAVNNFILIEKMERISN